MAATNLYAERIRKLAPSADPRHVEAWMRLKFGTLDGLGADEFKREVRTAQLLIATAPTESEELALSYGL